MFASVTSVFLIPAQITNSLLEKRKRNLRNFRTVTVIVVFYCFLLNMLKMLHMLKMGLVPQLE